MRPDDLFNAIGDADGKYVKRARNVHLSAFLFVLAFMANVFLVILFQIFVVYPYSGPITKETMQEHPWFADYQVIDVGVEQDGIHGNRSPSYVLYETKAGERCIVQIMLHEYAPKYRIVEDSITPVPSEQNISQIKIKNFFGYNLLMIEHRAKITGYSSHYLTRNQHADFCNLFFSASFLHFIENFMYKTLLPKLKRK